MGGGLLCQRRRVQSHPSPDPHIAFVCGVHSCLGAQHTWIEARIMPEMLPREYPEKEFAGKASVLGSRHPD
jgi:cytochrome P450